MIYLILDTNIWLYLANGFDPLSNKHLDKLHFELLATLKEHKEKNNICILINDVVIEEWKRNKEHSKIKIQKLNNKLSDAGNPFNDIRKYAKSKTDDLEKEYAEGLKEEITANEKHIDTVEVFLLNDCQKVNISNEVKLKVFDLSVGKKAPFHNKKNNIADVAILLSSAEFLKEKLWREDMSAIFVSNNIEDFTDGKNKNDFHPDIKILLKETEINFQRVLPAALKLSKEIIIEIEEHHKHGAWLESISFKCKVCYESESHIPIGYLQDEVKVRYESELRSNPNQFDLFPDFQKIERKEKKIRLGNCLFCNTLHVECPKCDELAYTSTSGWFECFECNTQLNLKYVEDSKGLFLFVNDTGEKLEDSFEYID